MHIAVIYGGLSSEREVSISSSEGVITGLKKLGYKVTPIDMNRDIALILAKIRPDLVFNCLHGTYGEDGALAGLLEIMNIPYTHSGIAASAIGMDKYLSRKIFIHYNITCPEYKLLRNTDDLTIEPFARPYVIKPVNEGSSVGVRIIHQDDDFNLSNYIFPKKGEILVEKYIKGKEIQIALFNGTAIGAVEIKPLKEFYDYEAKYTKNMSEHLIPTSLSDKQLEEVYKISERAYKAIGCRGVARLDTIFDEVKEKFYVLEINTHPGFTPFSLVPEIYKYHEINYNELLKIIVDDALENGQKK